MCSTIIDEVQDKLEEATAQLNSHVLMAASYIVDEIPFTFHTLETFELLLDVYDLIKSAKIQVGELQLLESKPCSYVDGSSKSPKTQRKKLVEGCSQTDNSTFFKEFQKNRMIDAQFQTETGKGGISTSGIDVDLTTKRPKSRNKPQLSKETATQDCLFEEGSDSDDRCCCSYNFCKIFRRPTENSPSKKYAISEDPSKRIEVDNSRLQAEENRLLVEAINKTRKQTAPLANPSNPSSKQGRTNGIQNLVQNGYINPFDLDESKDATTISTQLNQQTHKAMNTDLIEHPLDSKQHTAESLEPEASTTKLPSKSSLKSRRAPDPSQSENKQEANEPASELLNSDTKSTGSNVEYPDDLDPFQDDAKLSV